MHYIIVLFAILLQAFAFGQNYTSYLTGSSSDLVTQPLGGVSLMGGATEDDNAMRWFLDRANGGDVLVLRASGSDGYNSYFYSGLGATINSVETIVFNNGSAANEAYVQQKIEQAEAIWIAGGDQWDYISYWRNTPIDSLINRAISERNCVIGGTSAGMAIQGSHYFSAENGTVTSTTALTNPYTSTVTVDSAPFLENEFLQNVITDTHYDSPDRKGRHTVFLARILTDTGIMAKGIACDEYTAVCIEPGGIAHIYGGFPTYDDNAYFLQPNCELASVTPENCSAGTPLEWNHGGQAVKVYVVKGTANGANTFDLNTWNTGIGGTWEEWSVVNGTLNTATGIAPNCTTSEVVELASQNTVTLFPNPASVEFTIDTDRIIHTSSISTLDGRIIQQNNDARTVSIAQLPSGSYLLQIVYFDGENSSLPFIKP